MKYRPSLLLLLHFTSFTMLTLECFHRLLAWMREHLRFKAFFLYIFFLQDCRCIWQSYRLTMEFHLSWHYTHTTMSSFQFETAVCWWHRICTLNVMSFIFVLKFKWRKKEQMMNEFGSYCINWIAPLVTLQFPASLKQTTVDKSVTELNCFANIRSTWGARKIDMKKLAKNYARAKEDENFRRIK